MSSLDLDTLIEAVTTAAAAWQRTGEREAFVVALRALPTEVRGLLATVALAAADRSLSKNAVATAAGLSRGSAYVKKREEMDLLHAAAPALVAGLLCSQSGGRTVAQLSDDVQLRGENIARLKAQLVEARLEREVAMAYARRLHEQLRPEYEENLRTREERVFDLTPRLHPVRDEDGDDADASDEDPSDEDVRDPTDEDPA